MIKKLAELRKESKASVSECLKALEQANGNVKQAKNLLGIKNDDDFAGVAIGIVESYIHHNNKVGVLVEVHCETDATARTLTKFAKEICLQIAATNPEFISERHVPQERLTLERSCHAEKFVQSGKTKEEISRLIKGRMKKFYLEHCLMNQKYVQDTRITIRDFVNNKIRETGEKIKIFRFVRFQVGK